MDAVGCQRAGFAAASRRSHAVRQQGSLHPLQSPSRQYWSVGQYRAAHCQNVARGTTQGAMASTQAKAHTFRLPRWKAA